MANISLTTSATIPSGDQSITVTIYEDTDQDGTAENSASQSIDTGTNTYTLPGFTGGTGNDYWLDIEPATTAKTDAPVLESAEINTDPGDTTEETAVKTSMSVSPATATETVGQDDVAVKTGMTVSPSEGLISRLDTFGTKTGATVTPLTATDEEAVISQAEKTVIQVSPTTTEDDSSATYDGASRTGIDVTPRTSREAESQLAPAERDDVRWTVNGIETEGLVGSHPVITPGETATFTFRLTDQAAYESLQDSLTDAGAAAYGTDVNGDPWYMEQHTTQDTLLVEILPGPDSVAARGVWGILIGGDDNTTTPQQEQVISYEVFVLSDSDSFTTEADVEAAFKVSRT